MKLRFWKKSAVTVNQKTVIEVQAFDGGVQKVYVEAQDPKTALDVWQKVKEAVSN